MMEERLKSTFEKAATLSPVSLCAVFRGSKASSLEAKEDHNCLILEAAHSI